MVWFKDNGILQNILWVGGPVGAVAGTIPCMVIGGVIGLLGGNKVESEIDRH